MLKETRPPATITDWLTDWSLGTYDLTRDHVELPDWYYSTNRNKIDSLGKLLSLSDLANGVPDSQTPSSFLIVESSTLHSRHYSFSFAHLLLWFYTFQKWGLTLIFLKPVWLLTAKHWGKTEIDNSNFKITSIDVNRRHHLLTNYPFSTSWGIIHEFFTNISHR